MFDRFWQWYEKYYRFNVALAAGLFVLQLAHLYWLTTHAVALRLFDQSFFSPSRFWELLIAAADYLEIPAIIATSAVYINDLRHRFSWRPVCFLVLINSQWIHLFWITDEVVLSIITGQARQTVLPFWLAWCAIAIDYLELPVIIDTLRKVVYSRR